MVHVDSVCPVQGVEDQGKEKRVREERGISERDKRGEGGVRARDESNSSRE